MLTTTVNFPTRRVPSPQIRARDAPNDSASNGSAGVNRAPDVNAGANGSPDLGGHRCRDHEDRSDSTNYRKLAEQNSSLPATKADLTSSQPTKDDHRGNQTKQNGNRDATELACGCGVFHPCSRARCPGG